MKTINVPAKKADYYKQRLPKKLCGLIVELPAEKKKNNKNVKIYFGDNKLLSEQDKRIFNLLGVPDLPYHLRPMDSSEFVTLLFNLQEKTRVRIETADYDDYRYYALDDKPLKRKYLDWRSLEIDIQKGIHIVRLITRKIDGFGNRGPVIEPACGLTISQAISDSMAR